MALFFASNIIIVSLATSFLLTLASKWGWLEWLQVHAPNEFFSKLLNCKFCVSFWASVLLSVIYYFVTREPYLLAVPFCSTMIVRELW